MLCKLQPACAKAVKTSGFNKTSLTIGKGQYCHEMLSEAEGALSAACKQGIWKIPSSPELAAARVCQLGNAAWDTAWTWLLEQGRGTAVRGQGRESWPCACAVSCTALCHSWSLQCHQSSHSSAVPEPGTVFVLCDPHLIPCCAPCPPCTAAGEARGAILLEYSFCGFGLRGAGEMMLCGVRR